jgi:hypothetical protein
MWNEYPNPAPSPNEITFLETHLHFIQEPSDRIGFIDSFKTTGFDNSPGAEASTSTPIGASSTDSASARVCT